MNYNVFAQNNMLRRQNRIHEKNNKKLYSKTLMEKASVWMNLIVIPFSLKTRKKESKNLTSEYYVYSNLQPEKKA